MKNGIRLLLHFAMILFLLTVWTTVSAQQIKSLRVQNASLEECLKQIEKQTGYGYLFKDENIKSIKGISYTAENEDLVTILKSLLANTGYSFELNNKVILIFKEVKPEKTLRQVSVPKEVPVKFKIVDSLTKEPLIGATCNLKNYSIYGTADIDGNVFLKNVPTGDAQIDIQMLGYESKSMSIKIIAPVEMKIALLPTSLELDEIMVVAKASTAGTSTSSVIGRQAIDHLQATSLKDIMQLIPGQLVTGVTDMTSASKITIRTLNASSNNAFGTSIVVDGIPISDNATLRDKTAINATGGTGVDLRQIEADNIESVEVIRGIPSAEYGDLASGAVIVNTKSGYTPYEIRAKINPNNFNTSIGKGWTLGNKLGALNASLDYMQAWGDPRQKTSSFDRVSASLSYSRKIGKIWYTTTKVSFSSLIDSRGDDPDVITEGTETTQKNMNFKLSHNGKISVNAKLMRTLSYYLGYSESVTESKNSIIVAAGGGMPVITSLTSGYFEVPYITNSYRASGTTEGRPRTFYAKVSNGFTANIEKFRQRFNTGVEYKWEENKAKGYYNDDDSKPLRPNSDGRPRPYYDIPALNQISAYFEDNIDWKISKKLAFKVQAGLRYNLIQPGIEEQVSSLSPRINSSIHVSDWLEIRAGWGLNSKTPGLSHLYPEPKYTDRIAARYLPANVNEQLVMYHTNVNYVERNNALKNATNSRTELGVDIKLVNGMRFSVVGYNDYMKNGFGNLTEYKIYYSRYYDANKGLIIKPGMKPIVDWNNPARVDTVFTTNGRIGNTESSLDRGIEFDFDFGELKVIRTSFYLSGAYIQSQYWDNGRNFSNPVGIPANSVYSQGGSNTPPFKLEYPSGRSKNINERFSTLIRTVTHIPYLKMVATLTGQIVWYSSAETTHQKVDPIGWIDTDLSYHPITQEMLNDPSCKIKGIPLSDQRKDPKDDGATRQPLIWIINARLSKDVSKSLGFSFFVNNLFYYTPYQSSNKSGTLTERNTDTFSFGMELLIKI
jgi:outer membrane receptor protein involved in Fe transport